MIFGSSWCLNIYTKNALKTRMTQHRFDINHPECNKVGWEKPVALHFQSSAHVINDMTVTIARSNDAWTNVARKTVERAFIESFETLTPQGLNLCER